jgi:hypothetical protein
VGLQAGHSITWRCLLMPALPSTCTLHAVLTHITPTYCRNEARPRAGDGPPYALLQGRLDLIQARPKGGAFGAVTRSAGCASASCRLQGYLLACTMLSPACAGASA